MTTETELGPDGKPVVDPPITPEAPKEQAKVDVALGEDEAKTGLEAKEDDGVEYAETGDPGLDMCLSFIGSLGIKEDDPAMQKAVAGDFSLLEAKLSVLGDKAKGWERHLALGKQAYERMDNDSKAQAKAVSDAVVGVCGNAEAWATVRAWATANADETEKKAINAMFAAGPVQARAAAVMLRQAYEQADGTTVTPAKAAKDPGGSQGGAANGALSPKDYTKAVQELHRKLGNNMDSSPEYAQLQARRAAYRG